MVLGAAGIGTAGCGAGARGGRTDCGAVGIGVKGTVDLKGRGNDVELQDIDGQVIVNGTFVGQVQLRNLAKPLRYEGSSVQLNAEKLPGQIRFEPGEMTGSNIVGPDDGEQPGARDLCRREAGE